MKNTIFFDSNFNFTLLENEENPDNSIYIKFHTSDAANQVLNILANGQTTTESLASDDDIEYELEQTNWTNNGATVIWLSNDDISSTKVKIIFSEIPTASCAINRGTNAVFIMQYEGQDEEESGGGSGSYENADNFNYWEIVRNNGIRFLDEPSSVSIEYDEANNQINIKWKDPTDIATNEPEPAEWAGTIVIRKSSKAPLHKWDGIIITDSTTRDQYSTNALIDNNINEYATYYYGIFPYDTKGYYRASKVVKINVGGTIDYSFMTIKKFEDITSQIYQEQTAPFNISALSEYYLTDNILCIGRPLNLSWDEISGEMSKPVDRDSDCQKNWYFPIEEITNVKKIAFDIYLEDTVYEYWAFAIIWVKWIEDGAMSPNPDILRIGNFGTPNTYQYFNQWKHFEIDLNVEKVDYFAISTGRDVVKIRNIIFTCKA